MEIAVIQNNGPGRISLCQSELFAKDKFKRWVAHKITLHLYAAINWRIDDVSWRVKEDVYFLINVDEDLIGVVFADWHTRGWGVYCTRAEEAEVVAYLFEIYQATWLTIYHFAGDKWLNMGRIR